MELKVVCQCGQKFKFDVEPVNGKMPFAVTCPSCNADGTATANELIAAQLAATPPPPGPAPGRLRINVSAPAPAAENDQPTPPRPGAYRPAAAVAEANPPKQTSFGMGLLGGIIGALVGALIYLLLFKYTNLHFKLLAVGVGALAGWLAEYLGKGEGSKELGGITAIFVLAGIIGAQYFVTLGWWHAANEAELKNAQAAYTLSVTAAKAAVTAIPTGTDDEIRAYLVKKSSTDGEKVQPADLSTDDLKAFRENELPEFQALASGQLTQTAFEEKHELKTTQTEAEKNSEENTFKGLFLLLLLSKFNLFSLAAAAGTAYKLCTNA
jgi:uncharacterized membrane protein YeaQ/YmgE (transglycosylase-associated protein family)